jgi:hypothetical protein
MNDFEAGREARDAAGFGFGRLYSKTFLKNPQDDGSDTRRYPHTKGLNGKCVFSKNAKQLVLLVPVQLKTVPG